MNRSEFFATAKITRAPIVVEQLGSKGYSLNMVIKHEEEAEEQKYTLMYNNEPRTFKSLNAIDGILREKEIYNFTVKMASFEIEKDKRTTTK